MDAAAELYSVSSKIQRAVVQEIVRSPCWVVLVGVVGVRSLR